MLDHYFQVLEEQSRFSGVALITRGDLQLYAGAFGYASRPWKIRNSLDTRFDTASVTKLFTSVATLQLIDRGLLTFDTGVVDFLALEGTAISKDVNVFHLLTHTSGIGDDAEEENGESYEDLWKTKANYSVTTTADFLPQFIHKPSNFPPGQGLPILQLQLCAAGAGDRKDQRDELPRLCAPEYLCQGWDGPLGFSAHGSGERKRR